MFVVIAIGVLVGLVMGLTGAGGGIIAVPALVYALGWSMQQIMPVALMAVSAGAAFGVIDGLRKQQVRYRAALLMAAVGMPMTLLGVQAAQHMSQQWLMAVFAVLLVLIAVRLLTQKKSAELIQKTAVLAYIKQDTGRFDWTLRASVAISMIGAVAGFAAGLLGVGGGFIIVPMLRRYTNATMPVAVGTSLMVIMLVGSAGVASALVHGATVPIQLTLFFVSATVGGMLIGRSVLHQLAAQTVQRAFALLLLFVACYLVFRVWAMVSGAPGAL